MSPRAAWRLEAARFDPVYDYAAGKADWLADDQPFDGTAQLVGTFTRRGVLTGPHRGHAEPHHVPHLGLAGGSPQVVPVGGTHDHFGLVEDQHWPESLGL